MIDNKAVCRTAPATPGLLKITKYDEMFMVKVIRKHRGDSELMDFFREMDFSKECFS